jgi:LasA protease
MINLQAVSPSRKLLPFLLILSLTACLSQPLPDQETATAAASTQTQGPTGTPIPSRPEYDPGQLVDYIAQTGDTLPALAAHFNTTPDEIRAANPQIPVDATTMPPGMPMKIPVYYSLFWGTPFQILPDSQFINGPSAIGFDTEAFVANHPGWLKDYHAYAAGETLTGAQIVDLVATNYSVSPRVLLAILEYQTGALSQPVPPSGNYPLGEINYNYSGLYMQLIWAANLLNNGYYGWRTGSLTELEHLDGSIERPDPWQTAATVAFQYYFSRNNSSENYAIAIGSGGLARAYQELFGNPWAVDQPHIPVSLQQPGLTFPFPSGETWAFTGGPHSGWGTLLPWAAIDFAPPAVVGGCVPTTQPAVAMADGVVVRSQTGVVMLDLDGDGDERTGWVLLYLHIATVGRPSVGRTLRQGDLVGYPSCEGGTATGTHVHVARKYNGEWIPADSAMPFNLEGYVVHSGDKPYSGTLIRGNQTITACDCSNFSSQVKAGK